MSQSDAVAFLERQFALRRSGNPAFSLRSFARRCGVSPSTMSEILSGRRMLTERNAQRIAMNLGFATAETSVLTEIVRTTAAAQRSGEAVHRGLRVDLKCLAADEFETISDPLHFYVLGLLKLDKAPRTAHEVARRLGITLDSAEAAIGRLARLGLVKRTKSGLRRTKERLRTTSDVPSAALRQSHRLTIQQAIESLEGVPVALRDISTVTVALSLEQLDDAKRLITKFRRGLMDVIERGSNTKDTLYNLNIQFVPVTEVRHEIPED